MFFISIAEEKEEEKRNLTIFCSIAAIEIATKSIETSAKHEAQYDNQKALGALDLQKIADEGAVELARKQLLETIAENAAIESSGTAIAEAQV